jgi:hypothetical protein
MKASPSLSTDPAKISFLLGPDRGKPQDAKAVTRIIRAKPLAPFDTDSFTARAPFLDVASDYFFTKLQKPGRKFQLSGHLSVYDL